MKFQRMEQIFLFRVSDVIKSASEMHRELLESTGKSFFPGNWKCAKNLQAGDPCGFLL